MTSLKVTQIWYNRFRNRLSTPIFMLDLQNCKKTNFLFFRHPKNGTFFIRCLCQAFKTHGDVKDLLGILQEAATSLGKINWLNQSLTYENYNFNRKVFFHPTPQSAYIHRRKTTWKTICDVILKLFAYISSKTQ